MTASTHLKAHTHTHTHFFWLRMRTACCAVPLQIVVKCEQRVTALQQEHLAEMSKRDMLLQRAKDTILRLKAQFAGESAALGMFLLCCDRPKTPSSDL